MESNLNGFINSSRPNVCVVMLEENETLLPKCAAIPQPDGSMISMPLEDMSPLLELDVLKKEMIVDIDPRSELVDR
jgi:acetolactate synthase-1/2/3 large subunit